MAREPDIDFIKSQNWYEARPHDKNPERRAYHSSFIYQNKYAIWLFIIFIRYYIFGGRDLSHGSLSSIWSADISQLAKIQSGLLHHEGWLWNEI